MTVISASPRQSDHTETYQSHNQALPMRGRAVFPRQSVARFVTTDTNFYEEHGVAMKVDEHTASVSSTRRIQRPPVFRAKA
jgi:hypothetical protein